MPIKFITPPPEAAQALKTSADDFEKNLHGAHAELLRNAHAAMDDHLPHLVFTVPFSAMLSGAGLARAQQIGWRYLTPDTNNQAIEMAHDADGTNHRFGHINVGRFVTATHEAVIALQGHPRFADRDHHLALIRVPQVYVMALWLRAENADAVVVPLAPAPSGLTAGRHYSEAEFNKALQQLAEQAQKNARTPSPQ